MDKEALQASDNESICKWIGGLCGFQMTAQMGKIGTKA